MSQLRQKPVGSPVAGWEVPHPELRTIGQRLAHARVKLGLSQRAIADELGISTRAWQYYEQDERQPDTDMLEGLFRLGFSAAWVVSGVEPASRQAGGELSEAHLSIALELADRAIGAGWLPRPLHSRLVRLIYQGVSEGLPVAEVSSIASAAARELALGVDGNQGRAAAGAGETATGHAPRRGRDEG